MVYCLTSNLITADKGHFYQQSSDGIKLLERPKVIEMFNKYMGGVDLADQ
jgi:hypothetical protein